MASVAVNKLSPAEKEQLAVSYAALVLSGAGSKVTAESLENVLKASGVQVSGSLVKAFAKTLKNRSVNDFIGVSGTSAPVQSKTSAPAAKEAKEVKEAPKKEDKKQKTAPPPPPPPAAEEEEMDLGGMFD